MVLRRLAPLLAVVALLAACASASDQSAPPNGSAAPSGSANTVESAQPGATARRQEPAPTDCRQRIEAANLLEPETMDAIAACRYTVEGFDAARNVLAAGGSDDVIWAAIWVYAPGAYDPAPLRPYLDREDPSVRVLAAAGLVVLGDASGFDVLGASATNKDDLSGSHPPIPIREFVLATLFQSVAADGAPGHWTTYEEYLTIDQRWADWINATKDKLTFNAETGQWVLP